MCYASVRCGCGVKRVRWVITRLSACYPVTLRPSPVNSVPLKHRRPLPSNSLLMLPSSLDTRSENAKFLCAFIRHISGLRVCSSQYNTGVVVVVVGIPFFALKHVFVYVCVCTHHFGQKLQDCMRISMVLNHAGISALYCTTFTTYIECLSNDVRSKLQSSFTTVEALYRSACVCRHLQLRTGRFRWCKVLLPTCPC